MREEPACSAMFAASADVSLLGSISSYAGLDVVVDGRAVQAQEGGHHGDVANVWNIAERRRSGAKQRRDHRLADEVLGATYTDLAVEGCPTRHANGVGHAHSVSLAAPSHWRTSWRTPLANTINEHKVVPCQAPRASCARGSPRTT